MTELPRSVQDWSYLAEVEKNPDHANEILPGRERVARFKDLNNRIWGERNWIQCPTCPTDDNDEQVFHHKDAHG